MKRTIKQRVVSYFSLLSLLLNTLQPFFTAALASATLYPSSVRAEELSSPAPSTESVPSASPSPTPQPSLSVSPSPTSSSSIDGTDPSLSTETSTEDTSNTTISMPSPDLEPTAEDSSAQTTSSVSTDKDDYAPDESVIITGQDLEPNTTYLLRVSSTDPPATSHDFDVTTDDSGLLVYTYQLDGNYRPDYLVEIFLGNTLITSTTFTDSDISSHICVTDIQGANDLPGQKDLTQMCYDYSNLPTSIDTDWNWDDTGWSGANTGDACALFDTDGDGLANYATCVTVEDDPVVQSVSSPRLFTCSDTRPDRCTGSVLISTPYSTTCSVSIDPTQPFPTGDDTPNDTVASCTIFMSEMGGESAQLLDVCSLPSNEPNSDPSDCIRAAPRTGRLEVVKSLVPAEDTGLFNLQINEATVVSDVGDGGTTGEQVLTTANNGTTYSVGEVAGTSTNLANYSSSIECRDLNGTGSVVASSSDAGPLDVLLEANDDVVCIITNTLNNGSLTVLKNVDTDNDGQVDITGATNWTWDIAGGEQNIATGQSRTLTTGNYTISEDPQTNYHLVGWSCDNNTSGATNSIPISMTQGANITCTFTNARDTGNITILKNVDTDNDGQVDIFGSTDWTWDIADGEQNIATGQSRTLTTGNYTITEDSQSNYHLVSWSCNNNTTGTTNSIPVSLSNGSDITCTFTNARDTGTIIINKQTNPNGDQTQFTFTGDVSGSIADDGSIQTLPLPTGTYTSTETVPSGWVLESIVCDDTNSSGSLDTNTATINLEANETVTCTFTNNKTPLLTVIKNIVPSDYPALFNLFIDATEYATNIGHNGSTGAQEVSVGSHSVSETAGSDTTLSDFNVTYSENCSAGTIDLDYGDDETCTITNTRKTGIVEFLKIVVGGEAEPTDWEFNVLNIGTFQNGQYVFYTGTYSVEEISDILGYTATAVGGICTDLDGTFATLTVTEDGGICSFTNTRDTGSILVNKLVDTNGDGAYDSGNATANTLGFSWTLDSGSNRDMGTTATGVTTTVDGETHSVDENIASGYHFTGWFINGTRATCDNPTGTTLPIDLEVEKDTQTEITLCNARDTGSVTVFKNVEPDDDSVWDFVLGGPGNTAYGILDLGDGESSDFNGTAFPTGSYTLSESTSDLYSTEVECNTGESGSDSVQFDLDSGEGIVCTFTNTRNTSSITILKNIDWDESGQIGDHPQDVLGSTEWTWNIEDGEQNIATGQSRELTTGEYTVSENLEEGYHLVGWTCDNDSSGESNSIDVDLSDDPVTCTFTNAPDRGLIAGKKFNDLDGDHVYGNTTTDPNLPNWTIRLDDLNSDSAPVCTGGTVNGEYCEKLTNGSGNYRFIDLLPGDYQVSEVQQPGWVQTRPNESFGGQGAQADGTYILTVDPGDEILTRHFGNQGRGTITIYKDLDTDNDGQVDETNVEGWTWNIDGSGDYDMGSTQDVAAGTYEISENNQDNYHFVSLICDNTAYQSTVELSVAAGDEITCRYTNARDTGDIDGYKWEDLNGNSRWDDNENGLEGWTIFIDENNNFELDNEELFATTDENGHYEFDNLPTGEYTICEINQFGWNQTFPRGCHNIELTTEGESANFGNRGLGTIIVTKYEDKNGNGEWESPREGTLAGWTFNLNEDEYEETTNGDGVATFEDIPSGDYTLTEQEQEYWLLTGMTCEGEEVEEDNITRDREQTQIDPPSLVLEQDFTSIQLDPGETINCIVGNQGRGFVELIKDVVPDDDGESQWRVSADTNVFTLGDGESTGTIEVPVGTIGIKEEPEEGTDGDLYESEYVCDITDADGQEFLRQLTGEGREIIYRFLTPGQSIVCTFINTRINPQLTIAKENNATGAQGIGSEILFTLTLTLEDSPLYDVFVQDLPSEGFEYVSGSWTATSSIRGDIKNSPTTEPTYASPGEWFLGDMVPGEVVTLTYLAEVLSGTDAGTYNDLAYAYGCIQNGEDCDLAYATGVNSTYINDRFVGTSVEVDDDIRDTGSANIEGEVLGASTSLPATGANTGWIILAVSLFISGLASLLYGGRIGKSLVKSIAILTFLSLGFTSPEASLAVNDPDLDVRVEQPASPTRIDNFNLAFSILDIQGRSIDVKCYAKKPGESFVQFDVTQSFSGGGSGVCNVPSSLMEHDGTYDFYVTADAGSGVEESSTVIVELDTDGPGTPNYLSKDHPSECRWVIKFHTASDDGETVRVEIYSSSETSFPTDASTRVGEVWIGSDQDGEFIHDRADECNKEWYYVIRAFDSAGNQSGLAGDSAVTIITPTTEEPSEAIAVSGGSILGTTGDGTGGADEDGEVLGEDEMEGEEDGQGLISGAQDAVQEALTGENRGWWYLLIILIVSAIGYNLFKKYYRGKTK